MVRTFVILFLTLTCSCCPLAAQDFAGEFEPVDRTGANPSTPVRRPGSRENAEKPTGSGFADPRRWLFLAVVGFLVIGGGRKWLHGRKGRALADRLAEDSASLAEIVAADRFGRVVVHDLFRLMSEAKSAERRIAATEALVKLWRADELIPEEEKAIVTRSFAVDWRIRRTYPRGLTGPIDIRASFGMPRLTDDELNLWLDQHLRWSYRVTGTRRASDDSWQVPEGSAGQVCLTIMAEDFPDDGPHRLVLQMKAKANELTDEWTVELPAHSIRFEMDEKLGIGALAGMPDSTRAESMRNAVTPWHRDTNGSPDPVYVSINERFAVRNPPAFRISSRLPADLAHQAILEFDGFEGRWSIGEWVVPGRSGRQGSDGESADQAFLVKSWPEVAVKLGDATSPERVGLYRARAVLEPKPERGWSDPDIRSVWPETITSAWFEVEIVRR